MIELRLGGGSRGESNCEGVSRRDLLRVGSIGLIGLTLPGLLAARSQATSLRFRSKADGASAGSEGAQPSVILIWLDGGPSHLDMFDPKPEAPVEIRGEFGSIPTNVGGIRISDQLPLLAKQADKYSILRVTSTDASHGTGNHYLLTGWKFTPSVTYPAYGSVLARMKPPRGAMPPYAIVGGPGQYTTAGYMGSVYNPFNVGGDPNSDKFSVKDVTPPAAVPQERLTRRKSLLDDVDRFQRDAERAQRPVQAVDRFYERAFDLVTSPEAKEAFDLKQETAALRDAYGRNSFGQACLLSRRLVEAGTRFVHIQKGGWDTHQDNFKTLKGSRLPELDQGYAALLKDLADRGLLDHTIVICMGEFGRTPRVNSSAGRDHWSQAMFVTIGGGPLKTGRVVGETDRNGEYPADRPVKVEDVAATLYEALGIDLNQTFLSPDGRPIRIGDGGTPITELF